MAVRPSAPNHEYILFEQEFARRAQTWNPAEWVRMGVESSPEHITIGGVSNHSIINEIQVKNPFFGMPKYHSLQGLSTKGLFIDFNKDPSVREWTNITENVNRLKENIKKTKIEMNKPDNYCKPFIAIALGVIFIALSTFLFPTMAGLKAAGSALALGGIACLALSRRSYSKNLKELKQELIRNKNLLVKAEKQPAVQNKIDWLKIRDEYQFYNQNESHLQTKALKFIAQQCRNNFKEIPTDIQREFLRIVEFDRSKDPYYLNHETRRHQDNLIETIFENTFDDN